MATQLPVLKMRLYAASTWGMFIDPYSVSGSVLSVL
jgi:hypothetical protein